MPDTIPIVDFPPYAYRVWAARGELLQAGPCEACWEILTPDHQTVLYAARLSGRFHSREAAEGAAKAFVEEEIGHMIGGQTQPQPFVYRGVRHSSR